MRTKTFSKILLCTIMLFLLPAIFALALADEPPEPNYTEGEINYYLSAPDTLEIDLVLYGEHHIVLKDGETQTIQWESSVGEGLHETFSSGGVTFSRNVSATALNTLELLFDNQAYSEGLQFITGTFSREITAIERIASGGMFPVSYNLSLTAEEISQLQAGNFKSIEEGHLLTVSFPLISSEIIGQSGSSGSVESKLQQYYEDVFTHELFEQTIQLTPDFAAIIIEAVEIVEEVLPETTFEIPVDTDLTLEEIVTETDEIIEEAEVVIDESGFEEITVPNTAEVVAGAVAASVIVGAATSLASSVSVAGSAGAAGSMGISGAATVSAQQISKAVIQSAAAGAGRVSVSFIKDLITGLRDMFVDEGRAHASGKVSQKLK